MALTLSGKMRDVKNKTNEEKGEYRTLYKI